MPTFRLHKLVRDRLIQSYDSLGQQYNEQILIDEDLKQALVAKLAEEAKELNDALSDRADIVSELADVQQVLDDILMTYEISRTELADAQLAKFKKRGGFLGGHFIDTLTLKEDDEWVSYYRSKPDIFTELAEK